MKLLIANRGEIAVRIIRACREMGIRTVAVYSEADRLSPHVLMADAAWEIGPAPARDSYLQIKKILQAAEKSGADLVHPGYGFLAENAEFAEAVESSGCTWVGPSPESIRRMGSKTESRHIAVAAGAPLVPGMMDPLQDLSQLEAFVAEHGLPVLLKAVAGGGGKGMREIRDASELAPSFDRARSEGQAYFGDERVYVERLVQEARHIEIQVAADTHGNAVFVGERECSIQRRHQKVIEECPSPVVDEDLRRRMGETALAIVRESGYSSVGTVEFLVSPDRQYYFLEMNTRLQVEHPVTEAVYGIDLAREQIRIALGEELSFTQDDLLARGHAIECRVYAEDPLRNFAPSPGRISHLRTPSGPGVRIDSGIFEGTEVPLDYDPMLSKLIVWGRDRVEAVSRLRRALSEYQVQGIRTTLPLFRALAETEAFEKAAFHTAFLDGFLAGENLEKLQGAQDPEAEEAALIAAACLAMFDSSRLPGDIFAHGEESEWHAEGLRQLHGRFPR